jgi:hypothetical protein
MKKEERKVLLRKVGMILFLVMVVIGFTIPSMLDNDNSSNFSVEPRVCKSDSDCYLLCNDRPVTILCSQNLCRQNSCEEFSGYPYNSTPVTFGLKVSVNGQVVDLASRSSSLDSFVKFSGEEVKVYSSGLPLSVILEKVNLKLNSLCLTVDQEYCTNSEKELKMLVDEKQVYSYEGYVPQAGEQLEVSYS